MRAAKFTGRAVLCMAVILGVLGASAAGAQSGPGSDRSLHGFVSIGNADVFRGLRRHRKDVAVQGALRLGIGKHFFAGVRGAPAEWIKPDGGVSGDVEIDYFVGVWRDLGNDMVGQLRLTRYTYPGSYEIVDYDYDELSIGIDLGPHWSASVSYQRYALPWADAGGAAQLQWRTALADHLEVSAGLGGARFFDSSAGGYGYWDVGVSSPLGIVTADLRYHYSPRRAPWFGRQPAGGLWAFSLTAGW